jgi:tetratricopeptide (TPR) repeat protein
MGRALWLRRQHDQSLIALDRSVELSPNFALGHYALAFVHCQAGDPRIGIDSSDYSRTLSPFDPLLFAMLATRALAHMRLGQFKQAAEWAVTATNRPNAHVHILSIAAHCLASASRMDEARQYATLVRKAQPDYGLKNFIASFRFEPGVEALVTRQAPLIGLN